MRVKLKTSHKEKIIHILADRVNGSRFDGTMVEKIFALEDKGYVVTGGNKEIQRKFFNYRVAYWRQFS